MMMFNDDDENEQELLVYSDQLVRTTSLNAQGPYKARNLVRPKPRQSHAAGLRLAANGPSPSAMIPTSGPRSTSWGDIIGYIAI